MSETGQREAGRKTSSSGGVEVGREGAGRMRRAGIITAFAVTTALVLVLFGRITLQKVSDFRRTEAGSRVFFTIPKTREPAPEFELPALDGKRVRLSDFRGRVVFLSFRTTW